MPKQSLWFCRVVIFLGVLLSRLMAQPVPPPQNFVNAIGTSRYSAPASPLLAPTTEFTLEIWIYSSSAIPNGWIIGKALEGPNGVDPYQAFSLMTSQTGRQIVFASSTGAPQSYRSITSRSEITLNCWTHLAATISRDRISRLYINGILEAEGTVVGPPPYQPQTPLGIGSAIKSDGAFNYSPFNGSARYARFWNIARTQTEINLGLYAKLSTATGLIAEWPLDDANGVTSPDNSPNHLDLVCRGLPSPRRTAAVDYGPFYESIVYTFPKGTIDQPEHLIPFDYNSDGFPDIVIPQVAQSTYPETRTPIRLFRNQMGSSLLYDTNGYKGDLTMVFPRAWQIADFNRDGRDDLIITGHGTDIPPFPGEQQRLFMASSSGFFSEESQRLMTPPLFTHGVAVGDINGDGLPDIFLPNLGSGDSGSLFYINDASRPGYFSPDYTRVPDDIRKNGNTSALLVDINRDNRPDLVLGSFGTNSSNEVLINDGRGFFQRDYTLAFPTKLFGPNAVTVDIATADVNHDGIPDLLLATTGGKLSVSFGEIDGYEKAGLQVLIGQRNNTFIDATKASGVTFSAAERWVSKIFALDLNQDGHTDLLLQINTDSGRLARLLLGDGTGRFFEASDFLPELNSGPIGVSDLNKDNLKDIIIASYNTIQTILCRKSIPLDLVGRNTQISDLPAITTQPIATTGILGTKTTLSVSATSRDPIKYQWQRNGINISGATNASYTIESLDTKDTGVFNVLVGTVAGTVVSRNVQLSATPPPPSAPQSALSNLSVRTSMAVGQTLIVGAVINGNGSKSILARAGGPALNQFGLQGMADPRLELYTTGSTPLATNDDWSSPLAPVFTSVGAFGYQTGSRDAALNQSLNGSFTVQAKGTGAGTVLVELYDVTGGTSSRLINISARNRVGTGADVLIAGFTLSGTGSKNLLIRAVGPGLSQFGLTGVLADPKLQVYDGNNVVVTNDNWSASLASTFSSVGAFGLPSGSKDAAVAVSLKAGGSYTVLVSGADGGTGEALVEIYELP